MPRTRLGSCYKILLLHDFLTYTRSQRVLCTCGSSFKFMSVVNRLFHSSHPKLSKESRGNGALHSSIGDNLLILTEWVRLNTSYTIVTARCFVEYIQITMFPSQLRNVRKSLLNQCNLNVRILTLLVISPSDVCKKCYLRSYTS